MDFVKILNLWLIVILFQSSTLESLRSLDAADLAITGLAGICSLETLTTTRSHWQPQEVIVAMLCLALAFDGMSASCTVFTQLFWA